MTIHRAHGTHTCRWKMRCVDGDLLTAVKERSARGHGKFEKQQTLRSSRQNLGDRKRLSEELKADKGELGNGRKREICPSKDH